jgi:hypothetical protein
MVVHREKQHLYKLVLNHHDVLVDHFLLFQVRVNIHSLLFDSHPYFYAHFQCQHAPLQQENNS